MRVFRFNGVEAYNEVGSGSPLAADGGYRIAGLQPGTYRLAFDAAPGKYRTEYWKDARSLGTAHDVVITGTTPVTGLDATLAVAPPALSTSRPAISGRTRVGQWLRVTATATAHERSPGVAWTRRTQPVAPAS